MCFTMCAHKSQSPHALMCNKEIVFVLISFFDVAFIMDYKQGVTEELKIATFN